MPKERDPKGLVIGKILDKACLDFKFLSRRRIEFAPILVAVNGRFEFKRRAYLLVDRSDPVVE